MRKSETTPSIFDVQQANDSADAKLENALQYVLLNVLHAEVPNIPGILEKRATYSEDLGRVVMILMTENRGKDIYQEIIEIECDISECDISSVSVQNFLDNKILNFGNCLASGDSHECMMYMAIICEIVLRMSTSRAKNLMERIIQKAKENMRRYAGVHDNYAHLSSYARSFLNAYYSAV